MLRLPVSAATHPPSAVREPAGRTPLIVAAPTVALELPLKVLVWQSEDGAVWVGYTQPEYLAERHGVPPELVANVRAVETLAAVAAGTIPSQ
jgi:uncharacterized protein (DUF302 family)